MLLEFGFFGFERHVLRTKQIDFEFGVALKDLVAFVIELAANRMMDEELLEFELARLGLRENVFDEVQVGFFSFGVLGMARHRDVAPGAGFIEDGAKLAPVEEPALEFGDRPERGGTRFELVEQRRELVPIAGVDFFGYKGALPVGWQFSERQQIHRGNNGGKTEKRNGGRPFCEGILRLRNLYVAAGSK